MTNLSESLESVSASLSIMPLMILNQKLHEQRILYNKLISDYSLNCK